MQKGEKNKLKLLLIGIQARLKQNRDYFVSAEFIFKSGNKKFKAALKAGEENDYLLVFQGTERPIDRKKLSPSLTNKPSCMTTAHLYTPNAVPLLPLRSMQRVYL